MVGNGKEIGEVDCFGGYLKCDEISQGQVCLRGAFVGWWGVGWGELWSWK